MSRAIITILVILLLLAAITVHVFMMDRHKQESSVFTHHPMGTYCRMVIFSSGRPEDSHISLAASSSARSQISIIEALASTYRPNSEISHLANIKPGTPHHLSLKMHTVFERSLYYSRLTDGAFDVTVGPLMTLWRTAAQSDTPPTSDEIASALKSVGYRNISLDSHDPQNPTITLKKPNMSITLDAIVKGYAADLALAAIRESGAGFALVDLGGDIVCFGQPPGRSVWSIAIQNPFKPATAPMDTSLGSTLATIGLTDAAVATSGNYQRTFTIQGRPYSQILDPRTGHPVTQAPSVTIIAPTAADADALATACSVLPVSEALQLINPPNTEALLITGSPHAPTFHTSTGFDKYLLTPLPTKSLH